MNVYDRKLARAVYAMVLLAILAMVLAEGSVVYFALACLAALISWPIAHGRNRTSAVPRWLISLAVMVALVFFVFELLSDMHLIRALAHFMIFVQVCKFFENKRARDYGQLIVLSMLEIVVAAILSANLAFGVMLVLYMGLCIYTLLLFHFKREMELFQAARGRPCAPTPGALARASDALNTIDKWRFWRMSASTAGFATVIGVLLFLGFPRIGEGMLSPLGPDAQRNLTGFSSSTELGQIGEIKESDEVVMWVTVAEDDQIVRPAQPLLLRGVVQYHYRVEDGRGRWQSEYLRRDGSSGNLWPRSIHLKNRPSDNRPVPRTLTMSTLPDESQMRELRIAMTPFGSSYLFSTYPPLKIESPNELRLNFNLRGQTLQFNGRPRDTVRYTVWVPRGPAEQAVQRDSPPRTRVRTDDRIAALAREWTDSAEGPLDKARAISQRFHSGFSYTLQMQAEPGVDPLETFLFKTRKGHCEYFASAMTVMCQKLGIPARLVNGFKAVEFNEQGGYFIVRQKYAHSWVEVHGGRERGWVTFDPTPAAGDDSFDTPSGVMGWLNHSMDYLNFQWQQRVLNYSRSDRDSLMARAETKVGSMVAGTREAGNAIVDLFRDLFSPAGNNLWAVLLRWLGVAAVLVGLVFGVRPLRRRLREMFVLSAGRQRQRELRHRGLGFWADLLQLLDRHRLTPAPAMTPLEVTRDLGSRLVDVPGLNALARSYYKVRFGPGELSDEETQQVETTLTNLTTALGEKKGRR